MSRNLPQPVTVNDIFLSAAVDLLGEVCGLLVEVRDRLPVPAGDEIPSGPVSVTEPVLAAKPPIKAAKKIAAKAATQIKE